MPMVAASAAGALMSGNADYTSAGKADRDRTQADRVSAPSPRQTTEELFKTADLNGDGQLSLEELKAAREKKQNTKTDSHDSEFMLRVSQRLNSTVKVEPDAHWLIDSCAFKITITGLVLINAILMGVESDHPELKAEWDIIAHIFGAAFFLEMIAKMLLLRMDYFRDMWNLLDCVLAILGFLDTWLMTILQRDDLGLQQFSILRLLRLLRLARLARIFRHFGRLVVVMKSIFDAIENTFWVTCVLTICIYVCAIFCVDFIGRAPPETYPGYSDIEDVIDTQEIMANFNPHIVFGSMSAAMLTLFNIAIFAEWTEIVRPVLLKQPLLVFFFLFFAVFVCFGVMNVLIGMIVESAIQNARAFDRENEAADRMEKMRILEQLKELVFSMDGDGDMSVDMVELEKCMDDEKMKVILAKVDLPHGLSAKELLAMIDNDGDGKLQTEEFIQAFYRLIHCGGFQQVCLLQMGVNEIKRSIHDLRSEYSDQMTDVSNALKELGHGGLRNTARRHIKQEDLTVKDAHLEKAPRSEHIHTCLDKVSRDIGALVKQRIHEDLTASLDDILAAARMEAAHVSFFSTKPSPHTISATHLEPIHAYQSSPRPNQKAEPCGRLFDDQSSIHDPKHRRPSETWPKAGGHVDLPPGFGTELIGDRQEVLSDEPSDCQRAAIGTIGIGRPGNGVSELVPAEFVPPNQLDV